MVIMFFNFATIISLDDVKKAIEGREDFFIKEAGEIVVVNYRLNTPSTFEDPDEPGITEEESRNRAIRKECRGIIFDSRYGGVVSRPLHKFHNLNERPEYSTEFVDLSKPHEILEKLDGSMVHSYMIPGTEKIVWGTKMGHHTEVAQLATEFVNNHPQYERFASFCIEQECTPIFEFCSRKCRIVVDHPKDRLVLLAIRDNSSGEYCDYKKFSEMFDIEYVKSFDMSGKTIEEVADTVRKADDGEGVIIRFEDGHMVKIKADHYCLLHKTKEQFGLEKNVLKTILEDGLDDLLPLLDNDLKDKLSTYARKVNMGILKKAEHIVKFVEEHADMSQKEFAIKVNMVEPELSSLMFKVRAGKDAFDAVVDYVKSHTSSKNKLDKIRFIINTTWNEYELGE